MFISIDSSGKDSETKKKLKRQITYEKKYPLKTSDLNCIVFAYLDFPY